MFPKFMFSLLLDVLSLYVFSNLFLSPRSMLDQAGHTWSRLQCIAGREKEGGREADACDSVGAVMRVPMTEKQSVRPEHTAHSRTHAQNREGVMGWQRPGASLTDTHAFATHYMVNNEERNHHHHCRPLSEQNKTSQKYITRTIFVKYSFRTNKHPAWLRLISSA